MKTIKLSVSEKTGDASHVSVEIDGADVGLLYLKTAELDLLTNIIRDGVNADDDTFFDFVDNTQNVDGYEEW